MNIKSFYLFQVLCVVLQSVLLPVLILLNPLDLVLFYPFIFIMIFCLVVGIASSKTEVGNISLGLFFARAVLLQASLLIILFMIIMSLSLIKKYINDPLVYFFLLVERTFFWPILAVVLLILLVVQMRILDQRKKVKEKKAQ